MAKCQKHGVSISEIEALLDGGEARVLPDLAHSLAEQRFLATGRNRVGRPLFVIFTLRQSEGTTLVRPVSARYMHAKEARRYEEASPKAKDGPATEDR